MGSCNPFSQVGQQPSDHVAVGCDLYDNPMTTKMAPSARMTVVNLAQNYKSNLSELQSIALPRYMVIVDGGMGIQNAKHKSRISNRLVGGVYWKPRIAGCLPCWFDKNYGDPT